ncbi:ABC transporter ATP-binding protein [Mediterraneibacter agrestimuris]|uniref:ABC transporter ATP-binding protein n=1 Tax=Mediterraneibacter agrestimuris TaxID=2941333 RepID=UPI00203AD583|nr:ABC transporter ATP-binding protein [Mediterraneibacter agrestimuris]
MLVLKNIEKHYSRFDLNCSLEVQPGCITGLIGKNGAGKTTAFKAALGLIQKDGGSAEILGKPVEKLDVDARRQMGVVLADSGFSGYLMVKDVIQVMNSLYPTFQKEEFVRNCERFQLPMDKKIKEFSTGMKRKLQFLTAISHNAKLLILDEPTSGMDVIAREELLDLLREYMEYGERAILISSHISSDLEGLCDDLYMIDNGRIIMHEETDILLGNYAVLKVTKEQYEKLDRKYLLRCREEKFGYSCLTAQRQYYQENYPEIELEKGNIDEVMTMMIGGKMA